MKLFALAAVVLALTGCGASDDGAGDDSPTYSGRVVEIDGSRFLVREAGDPCGIWVGAPDGTPVEEGRVADVWISGGIAESCPAQATADRVELRD